MWACGIGVRRKKSYTTVRPKVNEASSKHLMGAPTSSGTAASRDIFVTTTSASNSRLQSRCWCLRIDPTIHLSTSRPGLERGWMTSQDAFGSIHDSSGLYLAWRDLLLCIALPLPSHQEEVLGETMQFVVSWSLGPLLVFLCIAILGLPKFCCVPCRIILLSPAYVPHRWIYTKLLLGQAPYLILPRYMYLVNTTCFGVRTWLPVGHQTGDIYMELILVERQCSSLGLDIFW